MWWQLIFVGLGMILAFVFMQLKLSDELTIVLAFLPVILSVVYSNFEKIRLMLTKLTIRNKSVSMIITLKKTYKLKQEVNDSNCIENNLKDLLLKNRIRIGNENNKLRIEGNQCVKSGRDNNLKIKVPLIIYLQINDGRLVCKLTNSYPGLVYKEIPYTVNALNKIWDLIDDYIEECSESKLESTLYDASIKVKSDVFKNVYLAPYAPKYIKKLELKKENSDIKLTDDILDISTKSFSDFEKDILQYSSLFKNYFGGRGD